MGLGVSLFQESLKTGYSVELKVCYSQYILCNVSSWPELALVC